MLIFFLENSIEWRNCVKTLLTSKPPAHLCLPSRNDLSFFNKKKFFYEYFNVTERRIRKLKGYHNSQTNKRLPLSFLSFFFKWFPTSRNFLEKERKRKERKSKNEKKEEKKRRKKKLGCPWCCLTADFMDAKLTTWAK